MHFPIFSDFVTFARQPVADDVSLPNFQFLGILKLTNSRLNKVGLTRDGLAP